MHTANINKFMGMVLDELKKAEGKHPKFCDHFIDGTWEEVEMSIKARNSQPPEYADCVLMEEVAEAFAAYSKGDFEHSLEEFAQCGAVVMRCMLYVMEKYGEGNIKKGEKK